MICIKTSIACVQQIIKYKSHELRIKKNIIDNITIDKSAVNLLKINDKGSDKTK